MPPSRSTSTLLPVIFLRTDATTAAQADEPEALVTPTPLSQTLTRKRSLEIKETNCTFVFCGNKG